MADLTPKDYLGNELHVGDRVFFNTLNSTSLWEGEIQRISIENDDFFVTIVCRNSYSEMVNWIRKTNEVIKRTENNSKSEQKESKNTPLSLRIYNMYENLFIEYRNANCEVKEFKDKLFLYVYSNSDNSILALWNMDSIYGFSFEENYNET